MDAGTATLVIYLAGMGPAPRDPFLDLWIQFPNMPSRCTCPCAIRSR